MLILPRMQWKLLLLLVVLLAAAGCQTAAYYTQAIAGQAQMLCCRQSVEKLAADPEQPKELTAKLKLVLDLREFAHDKLSLDPGKNYTLYKNLNRKYALWVVYAAPEFSVELKSWWYPVAGHFTSRGWFSETAAKRYANRLRAKGLDVHIGGAPAYSTLGWFDDPVLSTFIQQTDTSLAELIFHELTHKRFYLPGDTTFNESFATATAQAAVLKWLQHRGDSDGESRYRTECERHANFVQLILRTRAKLANLYQRDLPKDEMRDEKADVIKSLKREINDLHATDPAYGNLARWSERPLNNANLAAIAVYNQQVAAFWNLLRKHEGNLNRYFEAVEAIAKLSKQERTAALDTLSRPE